MPIKFNLENILIESFATGVVFSNPTNVTNQHGGTLPESFIGPGATEEFCCYTKTCNNATPCNNASVDGGVSACLPCPPQTNGMTCARTCGHKYTCSPIDCANPDSAGGPSVCFCPTPPSPTSYAATCTCPVIPACNIAGTAGGPSLCFCPTPPSPTSYAATCTCPVVPACNNAGTAGGPSVCFCPTGRYTCVPEICIS